MNLDELLNLLSNDVAKGGIDANSPGEIVRSSLAGQMPFSMAGMRTPAAPMPTPGAPVAPVARAPLAPVSAAPSPMPKPAAPPAAAMPAAAPAATPSQPPLTSWLGNLASGVERGGGILTALSNVMDNPARERYALAEKARTEQQAVAQQNQTIQYLVTQRKLSPDQAALVARSPEVLQKYLQPEDTKANATEYGTTVQYARQPDGTLRPFVVGKDGTTRFLELGEGAQALGPEGIAAARTRGTIGAKTIKQAQLELPDVLQKAAQITGQLKSLATDPYLDSMVGPVQGRLPNVFGDSERVQAKIDQLTGGAFLTAFESLKGGGQITNIEGDKATDAITRLRNVRMKPEDYRDAIQELETIVRNGVIRAKVDAGELPREALNQIFDFEKLGLPNASPPQAEPPPPQYSEVPQQQGVNPRLPGFAPGAGNPAAPNVANPRAPGFAPGRTLDAGDGFQIKVK